MTNNQVNILANTELFGVLMTAREAEAVASIKLPIHTQRLVKIQLY